MHISIWDSPRYITSPDTTYADTLAALKRFADAGVRRVLVYKAYLADLDAYLNAARDAGVAVEIWMHPERMIKNVPMRVLTDAQKRAMRENLDIELLFPCPNHPEYRRQLVALAKSLLDQYGDRIAGLHLDYLRSANFICCFYYPCGCEACRAERKRYFGFEMPSEEDLKQPWYIYKETARLNAHITATIADIHRLTHDAGRNLSMAARCDYINSPDIFARPVWGLGPATLEGQDWAEWSDAGIIDEIIPMNYHPILANFTDNLKAHLRILEGSKAKFTSGLASLSSMGPIPIADFRDRLQAIQDAGVSSACVFSSRDLTGEEYLQAIRDFAQT